MATIIPNAGAAGMALGDTLVSAYSSALREGLNLATQANMQREKDLQAYLQKLTDYKLGLQAFPAPPTPQQRAELDNKSLELSQRLNIPAGTGAILMPPFMPTVKDQKKSTPINTLAPEPPQSTQDQNAPPATTTGAVQGATPATKARRVIR